MPRRGKGRRDGDAALDGNPARARAGRAPFREGLTRYDVLERSVAPLYLHLAERDDLSPEEIAFFRRQLEKENEEEP